MTAIVEKADRCDLPDILRLQKAAFSPIGILLTRDDLQPLTQTLHSIQSEFEKQLFLKYMIDGRIVGSVRAYLDESGICRIGKLVVLPEYQSRGIGKALMQSVHHRFANCTAFALFTGKDIPFIVNFYRRLGYAETHNETLNGVEMVFMERKNR